MGLISKLFKKLLKPLYRPFRHRYEDRIIAIQKSEEVVEGHALNGITKLDQIIKAQQQQIEQIRQELAQTQAAMEMLFTKQMDEIQAELSAKVLAEAESTRAFMDARIWKAEQALTASTDARIWKGEQSILSAMEVQAYKNKKLTPQARLARLTVHLVVHCNLYCLCCDNFSPIAEKSYADIEKLKRDFTRLAEIGGRNIGILELSGGEALLHPQISEFLPMSRKIFPNSEIHVVSNGILLAGMPDEFWKACAENSICLVLTKYPININLERIREQAEKYHVEWRFFDDTQDKTTYHIPFDTRGEQNAERNFINCFHANSCVCMRDGRIYTCSIAAFLHHFNKHFNEDLPDVPENSIDIYKAKSMEEVLEFISRPIPLCGYCDVDSRQFNLPWGISKLKKGEWVNQVENDEDKFELLDQ